MAFCWIQVGYHSANLSGGWGQARPGHQNKTYPAFFCRSFPWWHLGWTAVSSPCTVHQTLVGCSCPLSESTRQQTTRIYLKSELGHCSTIHKHYLIVTVHHLNEQNSTHQIRIGSLKYNVQTPPACDCPAPKWTNQYPSNQDWVTAVQPTNTTVTVVIAYHLNETMTPNQNCVTAIQLINTILLHLNERNINTKSG